MFVQTSIRSSVGTAKEALSHKIQYLTEFLGGEYKTEGADPAWEHRKASPLRDKMVEIYKNMYGKDPVSYTHLAFFRCVNYVTGICHK